MNNKITDIRAYFATAFSAALFGFAMLFAATDADAQRRFDPKTTGTETELRNVALVTQDLLNFVKQAESVEQNPSASAADRKKLQDFGRKVKDGASNFSGSLRGFTQKLKNANRWNDEFDAEFLDSITNAKIKSFIQKLGGARRAFTEAEAAISSLGQDVDTTINDSRRASNFGGEVFFTNASVSTNYAFTSARKVRIKCILLGVGVAAAEAARLKLTAENLDNLFDSNKCGGGSSTVS